MTPAEAKARAGLQPGKQTIVRYGNPDCGTGI